MKIVWHRSCYQSYTSKTNIAYRIPGEPEASTNENDTRSKSTCLRSTKSAFDSSLCVFCQKVYCKRDKSLHVLNPDFVSKTLQKPIEEAKDDVIFTRLSTIDTKSGCVK